MRMLKMLLWMSIKKIFIRVFFSLSYGRGFMMGRGIGRIYSTILPKME